MKSFNMITYPHSHALLQFELKLERCKSHKAARHPTKCDVFNDVKLFPTIYRRIYSRKFLTLFNQMSRYKLKCIRMKVCVYPGQCYQIKIRQISQNPYKRKIYNHTCKLLNWPPGCSMKYDLTYSCGQTDYFLSLIFERKTWITGKIFFLAQDIFQNLTKNVMLCTSTQKSIEFSRVRLLLSLVSCLLSGKQTCYLDTDFAND